MIRLALRHKPRNLRPDMRTAAQWAAFESANRRAHAQYVAFPNLGAARFTECECGRVTWSIGGRCNVCVREAS